MNSVFKYCVFMAVIFLVAIKANAQFIPSKYEIGFNAGTFVYEGDLSENILGYTSSLNPAAGIWASRSFDNYFSLRANLSHGSVAANDAKYATPVFRQYRGLTFTTPVTEFSLQLVWDMFGKTYDAKMHRLSPYFFAGAGFSVLNIKRNWHAIDTSYFSSKSTVEKGLGVDTLQKTPGIIAVFPVGAGVRYMLDNNWYFNVEFTYRLTGTDYIDGFKYAANSKTDDHYYGLSVGLSYRFGISKNDCPRWKK